MNQTINNYAIAVAAGNKANVAATFTTDVKVMPPAGNQSIEGIRKAAAMLSAAATVIDNFKLVRTFVNGENWGAAIFEGIIDGNSIQLVDQVRIDEAA